MNKDILTGDESTVVIEVSIEKKTEAKTTDAQTGTITFDD